MSELMIDIDELSPEERLRLLEKWWDSQASDPKASLSAEQLVELDRRLEKLAPERPREAPLEALQRLDLDATPPRRADRRF